MCRNCTCIQLGLERAKFLIEQAMDEDQQDNLDDAFKMYMEAAEMCLKLVRSQSVQLCLLSLAVTCDNSTVNTADMDHRN